MSEIPLDINQNMYFKDITQKNCNFRTETIFSKNKIILMLVVTFK